MPAIGITATGSYLPRRVVGNAELAQEAGVTPEWIEAKTGITERRRAAPDQATSDLAAAAARSALTAAGLSADDIDYIVLATSTPDHPQPATASIVQHLLGANHAAAVDVNAVCSGFVYALAMAQGLLYARPGGGRALVIGADIYSRILDYRDRKTAILFGDGAGAVVLGTVPDGHGILGSALRGYGDQHRLISVPAGGSRLPLCEQILREGQQFFRMDGRGVREFVAANLPDTVNGLLQSCKAEPGSVAHLVPHQANGIMLQNLPSDLDLASATLHLTVGRFGNTGSASIPVTLDAAHRAGHLRQGDSVLLVGFGGGMNVAATLNRWALPAVETNAVQPLAMAS